MITKTYLHYPGYTAQIDRVNWLKNIFVNNCGMSIVTDTTLISGTNYYCIVENTSGRIRIEDTGSGCVIYVVDIDGNKYNTGVSNIIGSLTTPSTFAIYSKNGIYLCGGLTSSATFESMLLLNVRAKEIYGGTVFNTNVLLGLNPINNTHAFLGYYGEWVSKALSVLTYSSTSGSESGLADSIFFLTIRYNDGKYCIPSIFRVGSDFGTGSEFSDVNGDNISVAVHAASSFCICMDHILT